MPSVDEFRDDFLQGVRNGLTRISRAVLDEGSTIIEAEAIDEGTLLGSGEIRSPDEYSREATWTAEHAKWVHDGTRPHWPPLKPILEWVKRNLAQTPEGLRFKPTTGKRVRDESVLLRVARAIQAKIAREGTDGVPYASRALMSVAPRAEAILAGEIRSATGDQA